jgi:phosphate-selective porin OprO/OprP
MLQRLRFKVDVIWDMDNSDPLYHGLFEAYGSYSLSDSLSINAGRRKPPFTEEYRTSTKKILTFERSLLVNQVHPTNLAGTWVNGSVSGFSYDLGIYSGELDEAFGDLDAGAGALASIGYEFSGGGDGRRSRLGLDYLYNDGDSRNAQMKPYDHSLSLNYEGKYGGPFEVRSDLIYASGIDGASDVFGIVIMPAYHLTEKLQAVLRYQWATSDEVGGLKLQNRYERQVPGLVSTVGDEYHAVYTGLNYYIYGNKLKLMAGIEYSTMDQLGHSVGGFDGWTGFAGLRMYF